MSTDVKVRPNLPPALVDLVYQAVGEASMQWENIDQAGVFKSSQAAQVAGELCSHIARAWDAREKPLFVHLRDLSFNLGQIVADENVVAARTAVDNVLHLLEQAR